MPMVKIPRMVVAPPGDPLDVLLRQAAQRATGGPWESWLRALLERGERARSGQRRGGKAVRR
jgi:hypothetical protein